MTSNSRQSDKYVENKSKNSKTPSISSKIKSDKSNNPNSNKQNLFDEDILNQTSKNLENQTANEFQNDFRQDNIQEAKVDDFDLVGGKDDALDNLMVEDSYNDYLRDSSMGSEYTSELDILKKQIMGSKEIKSLRNKSKFIDIPSGSRNFEELSGSKKNNNSSVSYKNFLQSKLINDKLQKRIQELEDELKKKKDKESNLKKIFAELEQKNSQLLGENWELRAQKNELDELERMKAEYDKLVHDVDNIKERLKDVNVNSATSITNAVKLEKEKLLVETEEYEFKTQILNLNIELENE